MLLLTKKLTDKEFEKESIKKADQLMIETLNRFDLGLCGDRVLKDRDLKKIEFYFFSYVTGHINRIKNQLRDGLTDFNGIKRELKNCEYRIADLL